MRLQGTWLNGDYVSIANDSLTLVLAGDETSGRSTMPRPLVDEYSSTRPPKGLQRGALVVTFANHEGILSATDG